MAMEPAAISANPATTTMAVEETVPERPAARANGTVRPSDIPITTSRTVADAAKCFSTCGDVGIDPQSSHARHRALFFAQRGGQVKARGAPRRKRTGGEGHHQQQCDSRS